MKSILELYCEFKGWQVVTIHQAINDYKILPMIDKDKFCNKVFSFGTKNVVDLQNLSIFTRERTIH